MKDLKKNKIYVEAFRLLADGKSVMPVGKDKRPLLSSWKFLQERLPTEEELEEWWTKWPEANLGVITGKISGWTVLDLDVGHEKSTPAEAFPETFTQRTPSGGIHKIFLYAPGFTISANQFEQYPHTDMRSDGGFIVFAPSTTPKGNYEIINNIPPTPFPVDLFKVASFKKSAQEALKDFPEMAEGDGRNNHLTKIAGKIIMLSNDPAVTYPMLLAANKQFKKPLPDREVKIIFDSISKRESKKEKPEPEFIPSISFGEMMAQEFPKARFVLDPFFELGTLNMISAPPNTWKSWLLFYFASHIAGGTKVFDKFETEKQKVMIVNEEDSFRSIQDRFKLLGITDKELPMFFRVAQGSKFESKFMEKLLAELKEKDITVVIFDSLRAMHDADENDSTAMQIILDQMKKISREGITVIFTHHHRKKGMFEKTSTAESSRGSSAINAAISGHLSLDEEDREGKLFLIIKHLKSKAGEKLQPFEVQIVKDDPSRAVGFKYVGEFTGTQKKIMQAKDGILSILNDEKWHSKKDFEELGVGKNNLIQALQSLKNDGIILSITRKEAIAKAIPVSPKGHVNELYYSVNTGEILAVSEEVAQDRFDHFNDPIE